MRDTIDDRSLKSSDIDPLPISQYLANKKKAFCLFVPTKTGIRKSIFDALDPLKTLLKVNDIFDFENQKPGVKDRLSAWFLKADGNYTETKISLYRPNTKSGIFTRFWIYGLKNYASGAEGNRKPGNLLAIIIEAKNIQIVNTSDVWIWHRYQIQQHVNPVITQKDSDPKTSDEEIIREKPPTFISRPDTSNAPNLFETDPEKILISKLKAISARGFLPSVSFGPTAVGATLEHLLEIPINSSKEPDFHGIEIKSKRTQKSKKPSGLQTLFSKTPDWKNSPYSAKDLLNEFGYMKSDVLQLYLTISAAKATNHHGFFLNVDEPSDRLFCVHRKENKEKSLLVWSISSLITALEKKHKTTMWVSADSNVIDGIEHFHYYKAIITEMGSFDHLPELLKTGVITLDFTLKRKPSGATRDHGYLFRVKSENLYSAIPIPREIDL